MVGKIMKRVAVGKLKTLRLKTSPDCRKSLKSIDRLHNVRPGPSGCMSRIVGANRLPSSLLWINQTESLRRGFGESVGL